MGDFLRVSKVCHSGKNPSHVVSLKMMVSKRNLLYQGLIFRFHVKLQGCSQRSS